MNHILSPFLCLIKCEFHTYCLVKIMPDGAQYWRGNNSANLLKTTSTGTIVYETNRIKCVDNSPSSGAFDYISISTNTKISTKGFNNVHVRYAIETEFPQSRSIVLGIHSTYNYRDDISKSPQHPSDIIGEQIIGSASIGVHTLSAPLSTNDAFVVISGNAQHSSFTFYIEDMWCD